MKSGTYVRGWKFDWREAEKAHAAIAAATDENGVIDQTKVRLDYALHSADPGCVACATCGEMHWAEFEVFLCDRCGAEVHSRFRGLSSPPARPYMMRPRLFVGMRVEYAYRTYWSEPRQQMVAKLGRWPAGTIYPGERGTISHIHDRVMGSLWMIDFDGRTPKAGYHWGTFGPFLADDLLPVAGWPGTGWPRA